MQSCLPLMPRVAHIMPHVALKSCSLLLIHISVPATHVKPDKNGGGAAQQAVMICGLHNSNSRPDNHLRGLIKSRVVLIQTLANSLVAADSDGVEEPCCAD